MPADNDAKIEHVVVLALENRSFDHMLGSCQQAKTDIDGIPTEGSAQTRANQFEGVTYPQAPGAARVVFEDPHHETPHVLAQLKTVADIPNGGFIQDYASAYPMLTTAGRTEVMKYHALDSLPALHALARNFAVCDRWFSSVPGPTWANRLFMMSGTSLGRVNMPNGVLDLNLHWYDQPTIFDRLNERSKTWRIYHGDTPLSLLLVNQWQKPNRNRYSPMNQFFADVQKADSDNPFPEFVFVEPAYLDPGANDDHPSHDVLAGEALIASVYNALRANEELWQKLLLIVLFDEHGGFYDHVAPPSPVPPPDHHQEEYSFTQLGVRVPAILVSPYLANDVVHDQFDHTSLLKYLIDKWHLGELGDRAANATTFRKYILPTPREDAPQSIPAMPKTLAPAPIPPRQPLNDHQSALVQLSHALETMGGEDAEVVAARSRQTVIGPQSQIDAAVDRVDAFLKHGAAEVIKQP